MAGLKVLAAPSRGLYGRDVAAHEPLTALEASFLALERPGLPMHVAGVVLFDASSNAGGPLTLEDVRGLIAPRLSRLPKFGQRVSNGPFGISRPNWVKLGKVDLGAHLFKHRLQDPGRLSQLADLCGNIHAELLPRDEPLWQIHLIDGLAGSRQALVVKCHHAIADGIAGIHVAEVLFERARPPRKGATRGLSAFGLEPRGGPTVIRLAQALLGVAFTAAGGPIALQGPFNGHVGPNRAFAMTTVPIDLIRAMKLRLGGSVDDVLLAVVAAGLRRQLVREGYPNLLHALRAMLPVSTRLSVDGSKLGNQVSAIFVDLPLDTSDLPTLVRRIATSKANLRSTSAAAGMSMLIEIAGRLPRPLHEAVVRFASALPTANLVVSDVPGGDEPLVLLGRPIVACYPMIPLPPAVGLSVAAVRMVGQMGIGIVADPNLVPNPRRLAKEIEAVVRTFDRSYRAHPPSRLPRLAHRRAA
jgi:diacylglycerol O-acyltransferase